MQFLQQPVPLQRSAVYADVPVVPARGASSYTPPPVAATQSFKAPARVPEGIATTGQPAGRRGPIPQVQRPPAGPAPLAREVTRQDLAVQSLAIEAMAGRKSGDIPSGGSGCYPSSRTPAASNAAQDLAVTLERGVQLLRAAFSAEQVTALASASPSHFFTSVVSVRAMGGMQAPNPDARALRQTLEALSLDAGLGRRLRQQMLLAAQNRSKAVTEVDFSSFQAELGAFVAIVASLQAHSPRKPTAVREAVRQPSTKTPRQEGIMTATGTTDRAAEAEGRQSSKPRPGAHSARDPLSSSSRAHAIPEGAHSARDPLSLSARAHAIPEGAHSARDPLSSSARAHAIPEGIASAGARVNQGIERREAPSPLPTRDQAPLESGKDSKESSPAKSEKLLGSDHCLISPKALTRSSTKDRKLQLEEPPAPSVTVEREEETEARARQEAEEEAKRMRELDARRHRQAEEEARQRREAEAQAKRRREEEEARQKRDAEAEVHRRREEVGKALDMAVSDEAAPTPAGSEASTAPPRSNTVCSEGFSPMSQTSTANAAVPKAARRPSQSRCDAPLPCSGQPVAQRRAISSEAPRLGREPRAAARKKADTPGPTAAGTPGPAAEAKEVKASGRPDAKGPAPPREMHHGEAPAAAARRKDRDGTTRTASSNLLSQGQSSTNSMDCYAMGRLLGRGAFGKVNVAVHKLTEELSAMKQCDRRRLAEVGNRKCLQQEVTIMKRLTGHANIIQLFEVVETPSQIVLVMEFANGGDLLRYVRTQRRLQEPCAKDLFKQLMDGLAHVHDMRVVHRDIKLENLLLDTYGCVKIADFGVAVVAQPGKQLHEHCGTPSYIAPEILLEAGYEGFPADVWSSGVSLYAMLCGRLPFKGKSMAELKRSILRGQYHLPDHLSPSSVSLVNTMLTLEPRSRPRVGAVLAHDFLQGVHTRANQLYGGLLCPKPPEDGKPEGRADLQQTQASYAVLQKVNELGIPPVQVEESLAQGKFDQTTAMFHLVAQQFVRKKAQQLRQAPWSHADDPSTGTPRPDEADEDLSGRIAEER